MALQQTLCDSEAKFFGHLVRIGLKFFKRCAKKFGQYPKK